MTSSDSKSRAEPVLGLKDVAAHQSRARAVAGSAAYDQAGFTRIAVAHERFLRGAAGGRKARLRFVNCAAADFAARILRDADFTGANLRGARLARTNLQFAALYCANLADADLREATLHRADLRGASLRGADLRGADLDDADMRQAILAKADAEGSFSLAGASRAASLGDGDMAFSVDFRDATLRGAKLAQAKLRNANFSSADLTGADLRGANLTGARFEEAILTDVAIDLARVSASELAKAVQPPAPCAFAKVDELTARIAEAERWVATEGAAGCPANLDHEDLRPISAMFTRRRLVGLSARGARAIGVNFAGAQLQGACFEGADLRNADFTGADLRGVSFARANLWRARFAQADMGGLPLQGGRSREVILQGARFGAGAFDLALQPALAAAG